jgi:cytochrome b561
MFFHWTIAIGIIGVGLIEMGREELPKGSAARAALKAFHEPAGLTILALIGLRILWRLAHRPPAMPADMRGYEVLAARLMHWALYALMLAVPLLGLATAAAKGHVIDFGVFQVVPPLSGMISKSVGRAIKEMHETAAELILVLAFVHAAAAIWHHYVRRDDVLVRMLPGHRPG